jgi:hypothetical protein
MAGLVTNKNLREKVILGNRLFQLHPELVDILSVHQEIDRSVGMEQIHMVTTRSKSRTIGLNEHSSKRENNFQNGSVVQKRSSEQSARCRKLVIVDYHKTLSVWLAMRCQATNGVISRNRLRKHCSGVCSTSRSVKRTERLRPRLPL